LYYETRNLLWQHNTIVFSSPSSAVQALRALGQARSRLLERVQMHIQGFAAPAVERKALLKALSMLASRSRQGALQYVEIVVNEFEKLVSESLWERLAMPWQEVDELEAVASVLRDGGALGWAHAVQRSLRVSCVSVCAEGLEGDLSGLTIENVEEVVKEMHFAWGGRILCNCDLIWEDYQKVGQVKVTRHRAGK
jgi:hypothetical protein